MSWIDPELGPGPGRTPMGRIWKATVSRIASSRPYVKIERLDGGEHGPCEIIEGPWQSGELATVTGAPSAGTAHTHPIAVPAVLAAGDHVLVVFIETDIGVQPVIVGRLA